MSKKIVVQTSGGVESTTLLAKAIAEVGKENVYPICFNNDSAGWHLKDKPAIKEVTVLLQVHERLFTCLAPQTDILEYRRDELYEDSGFIPGFKLIFNAASMAWAQKVGATEVHIGHMKDNVYDDETPQFLSDLTDLYNRTYAHTYRDKPVSLVTPFQTYTKGQVITEALKYLSLEVLASTVSCGDERVSGAINCGVCPWCVKRRAGFVEAGITDPTRYLWGN